VEQMSVFVTIKGKRKGNNNQREERGSKEEGQMIDCVKTALQHEKVSEGRRGREARGARDIL